MVDSAARQKLIGGLRLWFWKVFGGGGLKFGEAGRAGKERGRTSEADIPRCALFVL
jgi:hypothetical protein